MRSECYLPTLFRALSPVDVGPSTVKVISPTEVQWPDSLLIELAARGVCPSRMMREMITVR